MQEKVEKPYTVQSRIDID